LTTNQEEALQKMAEASASMELRAAEEKKELEEHFSQLLQKVHDRAKTSDTEAQSAFGKIQQFESRLQDNQKEIHLLQSQLDQVERDRGCLLAAVALVSGILIPQIGRLAELASQRRLADEISNQSSAFRRHACLLVETLAAEFPSADDEDELDGQRQPPRRRGFSGLLSFRRAAIVVLASNRLRLLGHATKSNKSHSLLLAEFPRKGKKAPMLVGRKEATPAWMTSTKTKNDDGNEAHIESRLSDWLTSTDLQTGVILALQPLVERVSASPPSKPTTDSKRRSSTGSSTTTRSRCTSGLVEIASFAAIQMMQRVNAHFLVNDDGGFSNDSSSRGGNLCWRLGHGLSRALSCVSLRPRLRLSSAQEIMSSLQHHLLAITHRLHTAEVDRKELRKQNAELIAKLGDFKGIHEMASTLKSQTTHLQEELQGTVKAEQFASVCGELQATLAREQQTQKLLNHQASRIQNLAQESNAAGKRLEQSEAAVKQLTAQIAELKKDSRRKDAEGKDLKKSTSRLETERQLLLTNVRDAEKALTTVSKDKDKLLAFIASVETSLQQAMKHLKLLSESADGGGSGNDAAAALPLNLAQLISAQHLRTRNSKRGSNDASSKPGILAVDEEEQDGSSSSAELRAARRLVELFVDVYQAAFVKMSSMRTELSANQHHIKRLKAELSDACTRGGGGVDIMMMQSTGGWAGGGGGGDRAPLGNRMNANQVGGGGSGTQGAPSGQRWRNFSPLDEDSENSLSADLGGRRRNGEQEFQTPIRRSR